MVFERDNRNFQSLAESILDLDSKIISLMIVSTNNGSTLAEVVRPDSRQVFGSVSQRSNGMAGKWQILAFNSMERLQPTENQAKYLTFVTDSYVEMVFRAFFGNEIMIGVMLEPGTDALTIFRLLKLFLGDGGR